MNHILNGFSPLGLPQLSVDYITLLSLSKTPDSQSGFLPGLKMNSIDFSEYLKIVTWMGKPISGS